MKIKGLAQAIKQVEDMQEIVMAKIDDLYDEPPQWEEKDNFYNDAWTELDNALESLKCVNKMKLEDYL